MTEETHWLAGFLNGIKQHWEVLSGTFLLMGGTIRWGRKKSAVIDRLNRAVPELKPGEKLTTNKELSACQEKLETKIVEGLDQFFERKEKERADFRAEINRSFRDIKNDIGSVHSRIDDWYKDQIRGGK
jgi:hypothetical protein